LELESAIAAAATGWLAMAVGWLVRSVQYGRRLVVDRDVVALAESGRAHEISETRVLLTLFDGRVVFDQESFEASAQR
jgi:hypothetical protein